MTRIRLPYFLSLTLLLGAGLRAQTVITPKLDTPQARVYVATLQPHVPSRSPNGHATNRVRGRGKRR